MPENDNDTPTPESPYDSDEAKAVVTGMVGRGVSEGYFTPPATQVDLALRLDEQEKSSDEKQAEREEAFDASHAASYPGDNTDSTENFVGTSGEYMNYGGVSHEPLKGEGDTNPELVAEERILKAMADRDANSKQALGGHTTYGPAVEVDPVGRGNDIVRGGSGDDNTARGATKTTGAAKKAAPATAKD